MNSGTFCCLKSPTSRPVMVAGGENVPTEGADADGVVTLNISQLRAGTYIAVAETKTFKFNKR